MSRKLTKIKNDNKFRNSESKIPQEPSKDDVYRSIRFKSDIKTLVVRTEVGYDLVFEINPQIRVNPYRGTEKGTPLFQTSLVWNLKGARPRGNAMKVPDIEKIINGRSILPMEDDWDVAQLGFVYSNSRDPNNHKWWLETLKTGDQLGTFVSKLSEYTSAISSTAPIGSRSWFDGIHHGRFTINKDYIEDVKETGKGIIKINGNGKGGIGDIKPNIEIPDGTNVIRLRFDIRKNHWYVELLGEEGVLLQLISTNIKADANFKGHIVEDPQGVRPKVSGVINMEDVECILHTDQLCMIKGKKDS